MRLTRLLLGRSTYFQRYIERVLSEPTPMLRWTPFTGWRNQKRVKWYYDEHRPWTSMFKMNEKIGKPAPVIPIKDWTVFKGDVVEILVGKDKGKIGVVNSIIKERNWVYVEGLNCKFRDIPRGDHTPPMCQKVEVPLLANKQIKLVDPTDNKGTETEWRYTEEGDRVRVSVRSGRVIPLPHGYLMDDDLVIPAIYGDSPKDTAEKQLTKVTFKPKVMTFEEEVMQVMGIEEDRKPAKTYWY